MAVVMYPPAMVQEMSLTYIKGLGLGEGKPIWLTFVGGLASDRPLLPVELRVTRRLLPWAGWTEGGQASWWAGENRKVVFSVPSGPPTRAYHHQILYLAMCAKPAGPIVYVWPQQWLLKYGQTVAIESPVRAGVGLGSGES